MLRWVAAFCRPLRPVLLLVSFPRSRSAVVGVPGLCWMWRRDVPFGRQRRPVVGVLGLCWLLWGSFDCFWCPHTSVLRPSTTCLAVPTFSNAQSCVLSGHTLPASRGGFPVRKWLFRVMSPSPEDAPARDSACCGVRGVRGGGGGSGYIGHVPPDIVRLPPADIVWMHQSAEG